MLFKLELKKGIVGGAVYVVSLNLGQGRSGRWDETKEQ